MAIKFIILHWTGVNSYNITEHIKNSYQLIIDEKGSIVHGKPPGSTQSTGGMNSITYNISAAGGDIQAPLTVIQCERMFKEAAIICKKYSLTPSRVFTHHEIGELCKTGKITKLLPNNQWLKQNIGKIDLTRIPYDVPKNISYGDFIRNKIRWYLGKI